MDKRPMQEQLAEMTVEAVTMRWPETAEVFNRYGMACVGCAVAAFYSVDDAIAIYHVPRATFLAELAAVVHREKQEREKA